MLFSLLFHHQLRQVGWGTRFVHPAKGSRQARRPLRWTPKVHNTYCKERIAGRSEIKTENELEICGAQCGIILKTKQNKKNCLKVFLSACEIVTKQGWTSIFGVCDRLQGEWVWSVKMLGFVPLMHKVRSREEKKKILNSHWLRPERRTEGTLARAFLHYPVLLDVFHFVCVSNYWPTV